MAKVKNTTTKPALINTTQTLLYIFPEVCVSERKLEPHITIGFAKKTPKFVVGGKHSIVYEK
jgi:hypothetical protein